MIGGDPREAAKPPITLADIESAAGRIRGPVLRSPLRRSDWLSDGAGVEVLLKLEVLQPTFSYKVRGAINAVERHVERGDVSALVTASAGNHGRALAFAAAARRVPLTVYAPARAPRTKLDAIRSLGADLRLCGNYDEAERAAKQHAATDAARYVSPYNHPDVIAGAGTIGSEILNDRPDVGTIVVPIGGGGLISGIATAVQGGSQKPVVCGVEAESSKPFTAGRAAGRILEVHVAQTLADGLAGNLDPDTITFAIVQRLVPQIVTVSEEEIRLAMQGVVRHEHLIAEGAAAVGVAAVLQGKIRAPEKPVAIVLSGANLDIEVLRSLL